MATTLSFPLDGVKTDLRMILPEKRNPKIDARVTPAVYQLLESIASQEDRTISEITAKILHRYFLIQCLLGRPCRQWVNFVEAVEYFQEIETRVTSVDIMGEYVAVTFRRRRNLTQ